VNTAAGGAGSNPAGITVADINGDKLPDIAVAAAVSNAVFLYTSVCQ
jgi:hypothetical protein